MYHYKFWLRRHYSERPDTGCHLMHEVKYSQADLDSLMTTLMERAAKKLPQNFQDRGVRANEVWGEAIRTMVSDYGFREFRYTAVLTTNWSDHILLEKKKLPEQVDIFEIPHEYR